jgi:hypothetical protein
MGSFDTIRNKQVNNGIFIGLLVVFAAGIAMWWYGGREKIPAQHPLTEAASVSLCQLLPRFTGSKDCQDSEQQANVAGHSVWTNASNMPILRIDLISTHNLSVAEPMTSKAWLDSVLPEIKASGRLDWAEPKGAWSKAAITRKDNEQELMFEDNGIVVVMQSNVLDRPTLLLFADEASKALRKAKPVSASPDAASPKPTPADPEQR